MTKLNRLLAMHLSVDRVQTPRVLGNHVLWSGTLTYFKLNTLISCAPRANPWAVKSI